MKPHPITDLQLAFPANVNELMPMDEPGFAAYRKNWQGDSWGFKLFNQWFCRGLTKLVMKPKEGVDEKSALRHIKAIMRSFSPSHEDKTAAVAFLLEHWFEGAEWEVK